MTVRLTDRMSALVQSRAAEADSDAGMTTAEYAVGTVAACGCAGVLFKILTSQEVRKLITETILHALKHFSFW